MKRSLEMPVADKRTDGIEFIGPLSALPGVQKALRVMIFRSRNSQSSPLFKEPKILKTFDKTALEICNFKSFTTTSLQKLVAIVI